MSLFLSPLVTSLLSGESAGSLVVVIIAAARRLARLILHISWRIRLTFWMQVTKLFVRRDRCRYRVQLPRSVDPASADAYLRLTPMYRTPK